MQADILILLLIILITLLAYQIFCLINHRNELIRYNTDLQNNVDDLISLSTEMSNEIDYRLQAWQKSEGENIRLTRELSFLNNGKKEVSHECEGVAARVRASTDQTQ